MKFLVGSCKGMQRFDSMTTGLGFWMTDGNSSPCSFLCITEWDGEEIWPLDSSVLKKASQACIPACFNGKKNEL